MSLVPAATLVLIATAAGGSGRTERTRRVKAAAAALVPAGGGGEGFRRIICEYPQKDQNTVILRHQKIHDFMDIPSKVKSQSILKFSQIKSDPPKESLKYAIYNFFGTTIITEDREPTR